MKPRLVLTKVWAYLAFAAVLVPFALGLTACGGVDEEPAAAPEPTETAEAAATTQEASPAAVEPPEEAPVEAAAVPGTIVTVVGSGVRGNEGVGGPATQAQLQAGGDLEFDAVGNLYIAEFFGDRILKVDPSGILTVAAGTGNPGFSGDGGPAAEAQLRLAYGVAAGPDGSLYIADTGNHRIRMVDRNGIITTVAGTGEPGFSGDGGPATQAQLVRPMGLVFDPEGNLYIWDEGNRRIRMIDRNGTITTVAGAGKGGFSPDGTPATELLLFGFSDHAVAGLAFDPAGTLHLIDFINSRIRMIDPNGLVQTVAGNGENQFSGDGGPATEAGINQPLGIVFDANGYLYIATHSHGGNGNRIRMVDRNGIMTTIAGTERTGYSGDGGPATEADLNIPGGVVIGPDGNLYFADGANNRVRMVILAAN